MCCVSFCNAKNDKENAANAYTDILEAKTNDGNDIQRNDDDHVAITKNVNK